VSHDVSITNEHHLEDEDCHSSSSFSPDESDKSDKSDDELSSDGEEEPMPQSKKKVSTTVGCVHAYRYGCLLSTLVV